MCTHDAAVSLGDLDSMFCSIDRLSPQDITVAYRSLPVGPRGMVLPVITVGVVLPVFSLCVDPSG